MSHEFGSFFRKATGKMPFPFQRAFAEADELPALVDVPTGLGKTALAIVGWLWRRYGAGNDTRRATPRRLLYCLPMRVLVEQTRENAVRWLQQLDLLGGEATFDESNRLVRYTPAFDRPDRIFDRPDRITVHTLMGGEDAGEWDLHPEREMILIGTQDMLLSRALNRGYAASRSRWPMQFGLLHTDCLWVFDEIQLMGSGLATTAQLEALRRLLPDPDSDEAKHAHRCRSVWMSATLEPSWLETVDFTGFLRDAPRPIFDFESELASPEIDAEAQRVLEARWKARKPLGRASATMGAHDALAEEIVEKHAERRGLTLVVVNTVRRAQELHQALSRRLARETAPRLVLLHSRFRPHERQSKLVELLDSEHNQDMICVSTQVVEAGVDVDATTLFTELAPWSSLVQRFGRCNRRGERNDTARVFWIGLPTDATGRDKVTLPYDVPQLESSAAQLAGLGDAGIQSLPTVELPFKHTHVIRRRDLIDLFDTTPDLAGNDIDIDRYVREVEETDVRVYWREWERTKGHEPPPGDKAWRLPGRDELCPAPVGEFKDFATKGKGKRAVWHWNFTEGEWQLVEDKNAIYPGQTYLIHASAGGYDRDRGWIGAQGSAAVAPLAAAEAEGASDDANEAEGAADDANEEEIPGQWQTIAQHTDEVCREVEAIVRDLGLPPTELQAVRTASRWHDCGKAHDKFQIKIDDGQELAAKDEGGQPRFRRERPEVWRGCRVVAKAPGERVDTQRVVQDPGWWGRITAKDGARRHFRHELASALAVLQRPHADLGRDTLSDADLTLVAYLIAAHHGKVRLSIRSLPNELRPRNSDGKPQRRFARGVWDGDLLPSVDLGGGVVTPEVRLSLELMEIGLCEHEQAPFAGQPSWQERVIHLRETLGPFRLAYLEAILRAADMRASKAAAGPGAGA